MCDLVVHGSGACAIWRSSKFMYWLNSLHAADLRRAALLSPWRSHGYRSTSFRFRSSTTRLPLDLLLCTRRPRSLCIFFSRISTTAKMQIWDFVVSLVFQERWLLVSTQKSWGSTSLSGNLHWNAISSWWLLLFRHSCGCYCDMQVPCEHQLVFMVWLIWWLYWLLLLAYHADEVPSDLDFICAGNSSY
jgi:hypothetical protein